MKYLSSEPMFFGPALADYYAREFERVFGKPRDRKVDGPSHVIPKKHRCPSGRHDLRMTSCWCDPEK